MNQQPADTAASNAVFADPDDLVKLTSTGRLLAKQHTRRPDGTIASVAYEDAATFRASVLHASSLDALAAGLVEMEADPCSAIIRAAILAGADRRTMRRLLHPNKRAAATLVEVRRRYVALDFDGLDAPDGWWLDLPEALELIRAVLPKAFRQASAIIQVTASGGIKPGLRVRVWFRLARPLNGDELRRTFKKVLHLDLSTTYPATLTYTAKPIFQDMTDPIPRRTLLVHGDVDEVAVLVPPISLARPRTTPFQPILESSWGPMPRYSQAALARACAEITGAGNTQQHSTLFRVAAGIGQLVGAGHMPLILARAALIEAGLQMQAFGHPWQLHEIARQIDHGLAAGMGQPRVPKARP